MALGKWIGSALGWILSGGNVLGAIAGYCIGSLLGDAFNASDEGNGFNGDNGHSETITPALNSIIVHSKKTVTRSFSQCSYSRRIL